MKYTRVKAATCALSVSVVLLGSAMTTQAASISPDLLSAGVSVVLEEETLSNDIGVEAISEPAPEVVNEAPAEQETFSAGVSVIDIQVNSDILQASIDDTGKYGVGVDSVLKAVDEAFKQPSVESADTRNTSSDNTQSASVSEPAADVKNQTADAAASDNKTDGKKQEESQAKESPAVQPSGNTNHETSVSQPSDNAAQETSGSNNTAQETAGQTTESSNQETSAAQATESTAQESSTSQATESSSPESSSVPETEDPAQETPSTEQSQVQETPAVEDPQPSANGSAVVDYAMQFVGNPYVYGGTSLTDGADCSGFVMSVYDNFGVDLPHSSTADRNVGIEVGGLENAQPGDLICYSGHVAIYIGNGQIVHASTESTGIKISDADYRTPITVRRIAG